MDSKKSDMNGIIYDVIEEYTINRFVAVGGESIVFKGVKRSVGRTYALKFRSMERWSDFFHYEMTTLSSLEQCSTSKLAGVIPNIPSDVLHEIFQRIPEVKRTLCAALVSPYAQYFCIVEDYIAGCDLNEYCNGSEIKGIIGHTPSVNAAYETVIQFQRKLLNWTMQYCEIMSHVTSDERFLHLDIKPENIMISNETESITVIDFGKSMQIPPNAKNVSLNQEFGDNIGVFGTNGFAAPECCDSPEMRSSLGLPSTGIVDVRSDIFSFGATLWDCINPQRSLRIKPTEQGYFRRDLFNTPKGYIPELEAIIVKCTEKDPADRYQSYDELKDAAAYAEKKLLERDKPSKLLLVCSILTGILIVMLLLSIGISARRRVLTFDIARNNFIAMSQDYTEHNLSEYKETALALVEARPTEKQSYLDILRVSYQDDDSISKTELEDVLLRCLDYTNEPDIMETYVDTIMQHVNDGNAKTIAESLSIRRSLSEISSEGMRIARIINNYSKDPVAAYDLLGQYHGDSQYDAALHYLEKMLMNDSKIRQKIADAKQVDVDDLQSPLK